MGAVYTIIQDRTSHLKRLTMEKQSWKLFPTPVNYFKDVLSPEQLEVI